MSAAGTAASKPKPFAPNAKQYRPKEGTIFAVKHSGPSISVGTEHGVEIADDGEYIVQVGDLTRIETVPPRMSKDGSTRVPGEQREVKEPKLEVMSAEDFESLYEPA